MAAPTYTLQVRDRSTLAIEGEVPVYRSMSWQRRDVEAGSFTLVVHRSEAGLLGIGKVIEVRRDAGSNDHEFAGVITDRWLDRSEEIWTFTGPDLKGWFLERRIVGRTAESTVTADPGETAMKGYVDANGGPTADAARRFSGEVSVDWTIEADTARGTDVDFTALRRNLLREVLVPIARRSGLWHDVVLTATGYEYRVFEPTDSTIGAGSQPFSVSEANVGNIVYRESIRGVANALTVLGSGSGDARTTRSVEDSDHIATHGRIEGMLDERDATTNGELDEAGEQAIADAIRESINVTADPLLGDTPGARYREDWDLGHVITIAIPEESINVNRLVVGVDVSLERRGSEPDETITMQLGSVPKTLPVLLAKAIRRGYRASYE